MNSKPKPYAVPVYRLHTEEDESLDSVPMTGPTKLSVHLKEIGMADREQLVAIYLDGDTSPIGRQALRIGPLSQGIVHGRHVFRTALSLNADSFILVANRPNGNLNPSEEDDGVAERFARAGRLIGIPLLDYVVLAADERHFSYRTERSWSLEGGDER
jgi:DNA repair protein RadC